MKQVLIAKVQSCSEFKESLVNSESNFLAEAVRGDYYWSTGLDKELLLNTKKKNWPGKNIMGKVLTEIRDSLVQQKTGKRQTRSQEQPTKQTVSSDSEYDTS